MRKKKLNRNTKKTDEDVTVLKSDRAGQTVNALQTSKTKEGALIEARNRRQGEVLLKTTHGDGGEGRRVHHAVKKEDLLQGAQRKAGRRIRRQKGARNARTRGYRILVPRPGEGRGSRSFDLDTHATVRMGTSALWRRKK